MLNIDTYDISADSQPEYDPSYDYIADPVAVFHFRTKLRLVVDLQNCAKAQISRAYARKVKLTNLQQMAQTICYVQEHGYDNIEDIERESEMTSEAINRISATIDRTQGQISSLKKPMNRSEGF